VTQPSSNLREVPGPPTVVGHHLSIAPTLVPLFHDLNFLVEPISCSLLRLPRFARKRSKWL